MGYAIFQGKETNQATATPASQPSQKPITGSQPTMTATCYGPNRSAPSTKPALEKHRQAFETVWAEHPSVATDKAAAFRWFTEGWAKAETAARDDAEESETNE